MSTIATAALRTPWDCKWSRFGRMHNARPDAPIEGLWMCVYHNGIRRPIQASVCETCPHWEYEPPLERMRRQSSPKVSVESQAAAACPGVNQGEKRLEIATRVAAFVLAVVLAGLGFVVLTRPLAIPLTISLWMGALASFVLGVWGRFNRQGMPEESR